MAKIKIRKFLPSKIKGDIRTDPVASMTTQMNRLGFVVEDIGNMIVGMYEDKLDTIQDNKRKKTLSRDKSREDKLEKRVQKKVQTKAQKESGNSDKKVGTWITKLLEPFKWLAEKLIGYFALDWLSNPDNKEFIGNTLTVIGKWLGTFWKVFSKGVTWILEAFSEKSPVMGALKILGGLAALFVADRILKPWKLLGDFQKLSKFLGPGLTKVGDALKKVGANVKPGQMAKNFVTNPMAMSLTAGVVSTTTRLAAGDDADVAIGAGIGATVTSMGLTALLTPILGPFAPIVGSMLGGFIGDKIGAFLGEAMRPVFGPIKDYFVDVWFPAMKAFIEPITGPVMDFFNEFLPVMKQIGEFLAPIAGSAIAGIAKFLGAGAKIAFEGLVWIIKNGARAIADFVEGSQDLSARIDFTGLYTSDVDKAGQEFRDRERDVKKTERAMEDSKKKLGELIQKRDEEGEGKDSYKPWNWRYTIGERIKFEKEHYADLEKELSERKKKVIKAKERWEREKELAAEKKAEQLALANSAMDSTNGGVTGGHIVTSEAMKDRQMALSPGMHMGVDIATEIGEELKAFLAGTVQQVGYDKGFGNYIAWTSSDGLGQLYAHMKEMSPFKAGDKFQAGAILGYTGNTGTSTGPHLHWETSTNPDDVGRPKDNPLSRINPLSKYGKESPFTGVVEPVAEITPSDGGQGGGINNELIERSLTEASQQWRGSVTNTQFIVQPMVKEVVKTKQTNVVNVTKHASPSIN